MAVGHRITLLIMLVEYHSRIARSLEVLGKSLHELLLAVALEFTHVQGGAAVDRNALELICSGAGQERRIRRPPSRGQDQSPHG